MNGSTGDIFGLEGTGLCLSVDCPEVTLYYTMDGDLLSQCHIQAKYDQNHGYSYLKKGTCAENRVFIDNGISDKLYRLGKERGIRVITPR